VKIAFDPAKNEKNIRERGLSFEEVVGFDFETAIFVEDFRRDYGEIRWRALGLLHGRLHALVFVEITDGIRVISLRKANKREVRLYEQATRSSVD
jgi:uncharacterized protein